MKKHKTPMVPATKQRFLTEKQIHMCEARFENKEYTMKSFYRAGEDMDKYSPFDIDTPIAVDKEEYKLTR